MVIMLYGCASASHSSFVAKKNNSIGTKSFSDDVISFLHSSPKRYQDFKYSYDANGQLFVRYNHKGSGCIVSIVFDKQSTLISWAFIKNSGKCKESLNWSRLL